MRASAELKVEEFNNEKTVNFASRTEDDGLEVQVKTVGELPKFLGQDFQWCEKIINNYDTNPMSLCLLKLPSNTPIENVFLPQFGLREKLWHDNDSGIILQDEKLYFIEARNKKYCKILIDEIRAKPLMSLFNDLQPQVLKLANSQEIELVKATLGTCNLFIDDTISAIEFHAKMLQIQENYSKLAIIKINEIVGYGVIALEDISADSCVTFYSGVLLKKTGILRPVDDCEYSLGNPVCIIDAKKFRNIAGFLPHAFNDINSFFPIQENANEADYSAWRKSILRANLKSLPPVIYEHIPYMFFHSRELIKAGSLVAWDYGVGYWKAKKIMPALTSIKGEIISPDTYRCKDHKINQITDQITWISDEKSVNVSYASLTTKQETVTHSSAAFFAKSGKKDASQSTTSQTNLEKNQQRRTCCPCVLL